MVPLRLSLRNFLCYREQCPPIEFAGISMACLSGENGHGKSALLDALTWAVWGEARAKSDDELIHMGAVDMEVEFEFRVGAVRYRVLRKRRKGTASSPGRTLLEFQVLSGEAWKPLTSASVRETQARIIDAVRLDYETFRNSAFLMQGRADEFTVKAPNERKKVLAEILGLGAYDGYEAKARDERKRWEAETRRLELTVEQCENELKREPTYIQQRDETRAELTQVEADLSERRALQTTLREAENAVRLLRAEAEAAQRERDAARGHVARAESEITRQRKAIAAYESMIGRAVAIEAQFAALRAARATETEQSRRLQAVSALGKEEDAAQRLIEREAQALQARLERLRAEVERHTAVLATRREAEARAATLAADRAALDLTERRLREARRELEEQSNTAGQLQAENTRLRAEMAEIKRKQTELEAGGARCPICGTELGEDGKQRIRESYEAEGKQLAARFRENKARQGDAEARAHALRADLDRAEGEHERSRRALERGTAEVERSLRDGNEAAAALPALEQQLAAAQQTLVAESFAGEARAKLAAVRQQIAAHGYDRAAHQQAGADVRRLAPVEDEFMRLQGAQKAVGAAEDALRLAEQDRRDWTERLEQVQASLDRLSAQVSAQPDPRAPLQRLAEQIAGQEAIERRLRGTLGAAEQKLDDCVRYRRQHAAAQSELTTTRHKERIYDDLAVSFGKRGVQALIIDSVLPEIEMEANRLLARMTNGRMTVALETQRTTQKGAVSETLEVKIADELGTRAYELFSGGEGFRINLALRIALSKLLARRAGAPLPTLIVDEGFGTQDTAGRERLLEAMNAVARDFECLIVITHIDELKDQFEQQIRVEKTAEGSIARVL